MKKLVLMFVAFAAISLASCGNQTAAPAEEVDSLDSTLVEEVVDTVAADTTVAE